MTDLLARERLAAKRLLDARRAQLANATVLDEFMLRYAHDLAASQPRGDSTIPQLPLLGSVVGTDLVPVWHNGSTYSVQANVLQAVTPIPAIVYNVAAYGAVGDGVTDDTVSIQKAATAAYNGKGLLYFPPGAAGIYLVTIAGTVNGVAYSILTPGPIPIQGVGADCVTIRLKNSQITSAQSSYAMFATASSFTTGALEFRDITLDGNGANQNFASFTNNTYFNVFTAINQTSANTTARIRAERTTFENWTMVGTTTIPHGTALNTFSFCDQFITNCLFENCDYGVFVTQAVIGNNNQTGISNCLFHNIWNLGVYNESFSNVRVRGCAFFNDTLISGTVGVIGYGVLTNSTVLRNIVSDCIFENIGYPLSLGMGGADFVQDSLFSNMSAHNCRGSFNISKADSTCHFSNILADTLAIGGITGATVFGDYEVNTGGADCVVASNLHSVNSQNYAFSVQGKLHLSGGSVSTPKNGKFNFSANVQPTCNISDIYGYNPLGIVTVAVPASGTAYTNQFGSPIDIYSSGGTVTVIAVDGTTTGFTSGTFSLDPGETITWTYSVAPTVVAKGR